MSFIETNDNTPLFYEDWGTGQPLVFLHAWAMNSDMWHPHMLFFNDQKMRCITYDRRGHGRSGRPRDGHHYDSYADDLETLLSHLDLREITLVGHSMGGGEIVRYLTRHGSGRVRRIVLIAAAIPYLLRTSNNPEGIDITLFDATRAAMRKDFPNWLVENSNGFYLPGNFAISQAMMDWTINMILTTSLKTAIDGTYQVSETDFRNELQNITMPALIIHGTADASIPVYFGRKTAELIPHCEYKEYEGAPHGIFFTHIDSLNSDILNFMDSN